MKQLKFLRKRGLALFMALTMCLSLVQVTAFAQDDLVPDDVVDMDGIVDAVEYSVELNSETLELTVDETAGLTAAVTPEDAEVVWTSEDEGVATVKDGLVTAVAEGETTITASVGEGAASASCVVTVAAAEEEEVVGDEDVPDDENGSVDEDIPDSDDDSEDEDIPDEEETVEDENVPDNNVVDVVPEEVQEFLDAVDALNELSELDDADALLLGLKKADELYDLLSEEQKARDDVKACREMLDEFWGAVTMEEPEDGDNVVTTPEALQAAVSAGGTVVLGNDIIDNITIPKDVTVTLDLAGHTLAGTGSGSVITVNGTLTLEDSGSTGTITGGNATYGGGVRVSTDATFTMSGGSISSNSGTLGCGVYNAGTFTMKDGVISGNNASAFGGGVYTTKDFIMEGGEISGNNVIRGGGVFLHGETSTFTMKGGKISGNTATEFGGGVMTFGADKIVIGEDAAVSGNGAGLMGGGIFAAGTIIIDGTVSDNEAGLPGKHGGTGTASKGAGLCTTGGQITVNGQILRNGTGTAINGKKYDVVEYGGGIALSDGSSLVMNNGARISDNKAKWGGGVTIGECEQKELNAHAYSPADGTNLLFEMNGGEISGNTAEYGGGVRIDACDGTDAGAMAGTFKMHDGTITDNIASKNGGGVYVVQKALFEMSGGTISGNTAPRGAGVYSQGTMTMTGGEITENKRSGVTAIGGGVYIDADSSLSMSGNAVISKNELTGWDTSNLHYGGGVYIGENSTFTMSGHASITENVVSNPCASNYGGGVYVDKNGTFTMSEYASVSQNTANTAMGYGASGNNCGGGVCIVGGAEFTMSDNTEIRGNKIGYDTGIAHGGGLYADCSVVKLSGNASISDNLAPYGLYENAGGTAGIWLTNLFASDPQPVEISGNVTISDNVGNGSGGGINVYFCKVILDGVTISGNSGKVGGGLSVHGGEVTLKKAEIYDNTATVYGGGIGMQAPALVTIGDDVGRDDVRIHDNEATYGGGVCIGECGLYDDPSSKFDDWGINYIATEMKGATENFKFTMKGGSITGNKAKYGGGVDVNLCENVGDSGMFEMSGGVISGNEATYGGGVHVAGKFDVSGDAEISENTADYGGGVYIGTETLKCTDTASVSGGKITGNTAQYHGGGVYCLGSFDLSGTGSIKNNTAAGNGGGVYLTKYERVSEMTSVGQMTMTGGELYSNLAAAGKGNQGDDVYSIGTLNLIDISGKGWKLDEEHGGAEDDSGITGWFFDGAGDDDKTDRWSTDGYYREYTPVATTSKIALKAAYQPYAYTVEYYYGSQGSYTKADGQTVNGSGALGSAIPYTAGEKAAYNGRNYALNHVDGAGKTITSVAADNLVRVYYDLLYTVTWENGYPDPDPDDDPTIKDEEYKDGETPADTDYPEPPEAPEGYEFDGWEVSKPDKDGNVTITAKWKPVAVRYTVNYLEKGTGKVLHPATTVEDQVFGTVIESQKLAIGIVGYSFDSADPETLTLTTGKNVINIYYTAVNGLSYTVNYLEQGTNTVLRAAKTVGEQTFGTVINSADEVVSIAGYTYRSADKESLTIGTGENVLNLYYTRNSTPGGNPGNPGTPSTPSTPSNPGTTIPNNPVPQAPGENIADQDVPLANAVGLNDTDHFAYVIGYEDDTVRPLNNISRAEVATIFFRLMTEDFRVANWATANSFTDVGEKDWYNVAISTCAKAGALKGREDGSFDPDAYITRAEFAAIAARFMDDSIVDDGRGDFSDTANHWAAKEIRMAAKAGWVNGSGNLFRPNDYITRAEVMTIVNRMLDRTPDKDHMLPTMKKWIDNPEDAWYYEAVQEATNEHAYTRDELNVETWTELLTVRDWAALELGWKANGGASTPAAAPAETPVDGDAEAPAEGEEA